MNIIQLLLKITLIIFIAVNAHAAKSTWRNETYKHVSINQDLVQLLSSFASENGFSIIFSDAIKQKPNQKVNGNFNLKAEEFLNEICDLYNLIWFFDGQILYVYGSEEQVSKILNVDESQANLTRSAINKLGVMDDRFSWIYLAEEKILHIHGPPAYINMIEHIHSKLKAVEIIDKNENQVIDEAYVVQVFPLDYAWAEDQYYDDAGKQRKVEGVASKLRKMFYVDQKENNIDPTILMNNKRNQNELNSAQGKGIVDDLNSNNNVEGAISNEYSGIVKAMNTIANNKSYIEADELTNSVIIYDKTSSIGLYEKIIKSMDVSVAQVQIEVSIIEINTDRLGELGIDWQLNGDDGTIGINNINDTFNTGNGANILFRKPGDFSTIFTGSSTNLLARVHALSTDGEGQVMSQPAVLTMNNTAAMIDNSQTFFVQLEGVEQVDLREIKVGSLLKVTPRIINEAMQRRVQLKIIIEDGLITNKQVDKLPIIQKSIINTNTSISENTSLLIGGYYFDKIRVSEQKVPFLGNIPVIKHLFTNKTSERSKVARMFLITPTIIDNLHDKQYKFDNAKKIVDDIKVFSNVNSEKPTFKIFE